VSASTFRGAVLPGTVILDPHYVQWIEGDDFTIPVQHGQRTSGDQNRLRMVKIRKPAG
jgi:hypothetical protein